MSSRKILDYLFFLVMHLVYLVSSQKTRSESELNCIRANSNWKSLYSRDDMIKDASTCTTISDNCCHISIKYNYHGIISMEKSYCYSGTGKIEDWIQKFTNLYQDELKFYANKFNASYEDYVLIGNNLNYDYHENYTCKETASDVEFSDYEIKNCAYFNLDGTCGIQNDEKYVEKFLDVLYKNITSGICNNRDIVTGKCIEYNTDPNANSTALKPLMDLIWANIIHYEKTEEIINNTIIEEKPSWPGPCSPIPKVKVKVTCPQTYTFANFLVYEKYLIISLIVFILFF